MRPVAQGVVMFAFLAALALAASVQSDALVAPQGNNPLAPLAEFVPQANDVGLHFVIARNSGGAGRALFEPIIGKMREVSSPGLAMSANKDDGQLVGNVKSRQLPPGRGTLVSRSLKGGPQLIQTAYLPGE